MLMNSPRTTHFETGVASTALAPQLFFEDATLWETAPKLMRLIESASSDNRLYFEALGIVLAYELVHLAHGA
jgi:AraC family transcriptional regulator